MELVSSEKPISLLGLQTAVFSLFFTQMVLLLCVCVLRCSSFKNTSHTGFRSTQMTSFYLNYLFKGPIFKNQSYSEVLEIQFSSVQLLSRVQLFVTPWTAAGQASLSITNSWSLLKLISIESVMPSSHLIRCRPLLLLPPIPPSISLFQ